MKKLSFLLGIAVGFVLGSKSGTGPYEQLESSVRSLTGRPEVQDTAEKAKQAANEQVSGVVDKLNDKLPSSKEPTPPRS